MISYAAYCGTEVVHNCAYEVAKYLMADIQIAND